MESQFKSYTKEELVKKLKTQQMILIIHGVVVISLFVISGISTYNEGFSASRNLLPLCFLPMQIYLMLDVRKIKIALKYKS